MILDLGTLVFGPRHDHLSDQLGVQRPFLPHHLHPELLFGWKIAQEKPPCQGPSPTALRYPYIVKLKTPFSTPNQVSKVN